MITISAKESKNNLQNFKNFSAVPEVVKIYDVRAGKMFL